MTGFFDFMKNNIAHVAPILLAGGFAVAIIVERSKALYTTYPIKDQQGFFDKITDLILAGKLSDAVALCDRYQNKPVARVVKQGLLRAHQPESLIEHGLQLAVGDATQPIQKRTSFLAMIANVATLLGLLGTIAGLIHSFEAVGHADAQQKSALLAAGISTAMNATMMGLGVAIPCMVAFSFLMNKTNKLISEIDQSAVRTMDILKQRYYAAETAAIHGESDSFEDDAEHVASGNGRGNGKVVAMRRAV